MGRYLWVSRIKLCPRLMVLPFWQLPSRPRFWPRPRGALFKQSRLRSLVPSCTSAPRRDLGLCPGCRLDLLEELVARWGVDLAGSLHIAADDDMTVNKHGAEQLRLSRQDIDEYYRFLSSEFYTNLRAGDKVNMRLPRTGKMLLVRIGSLNRGSEFAVTVALYPE